MSLLHSLGLLAGLCAIYYVQGAPVENADDAKMYLQRYNYMGRGNMETGELMTGVDFVAAIEAFQSMANLTITGNLDNATMEMMNLPRCGMPDNMGFSNKARRKRYSTVARWGKKDLTWRINKNTPDLADADTRTIMTRALQIWSDVSGLKFREIQAGAGDADIIIDFYEGDHGDGYPFDGPGNELAHAFYPKPGNHEGDAHFDDSELFTQNTTKGINLFQIAAHEFGHSLGLGHSADPNALMYFMYNGYIPNFKLHKDDIRGIQYLYGDDTPDPTMRPFKPPITCPGKVDTFVTTNDDKTFAFTGNLVYQIETTGVVDGFPKPIKDVFKGLPDNLDAGLCYPGNGKTYFFKGNQYWRFDRTTADPGYPRPITNWGLSSNIDAAFVWSGNNRVYFIKGDQYYRYNMYRGRIDNRYPRPLSVWELPVSKVDAAMQWLNKRTYFFAGDSYYRLNDRRFEVDDSYPRATDFWWFGCGENKLGRIEQDTGSGENGAIFSVPNTLVILVSAVLGLFHLI